MSMEKRGIVDGNTPPEKSGCCSGSCGKGPKTQTKEAADRQEDHLTTRLSDAAAEAFKPKK